MPQNPPQSLESVLARIPFYGGYLAKQRYNENQQASELEQAGALQALQEHVTKQQREADFRAELGKLGDKPSQESLAAVAAKYSPAADILKSQTSSLDRKATIDATREAARSRLQNAASQFQSNFQIRLRNAQNTEERNQVLREYEQGKLELQAASINATGERLFYDTGIRTPTATAPDIGGRRPTSLSDLNRGTPPQQPQSLASLLPSNVPPSDEAAYLAARAGGSGTVNRVMGPQETAGMVDMGESPSPQVAAAAPDAGNLDARDLRLRRTQAVPAPEAQAPEQATPGLPRALETAPARFQDEWLLKKAGAPERPMPQKLRDQIEASRQRSLAVQTGVARSPESLRDDAMYQIINGVPRPGSIPTGRQGEGNVYRAQIADEIRKIASEKGMTPEELAGKRIENRANSVALSAVTKDLAALTPFKEMLDTNAKVAMDLGRKLADDKTNSAFINRPLIWVKNNLSNRPDISEYLAQIHFVEVEAARVLTQPRLVGQLTDQAIKDMKAVLSGNMTIASTEAVLHRIMADGNNRINAMRAQRDRTISDVRGPSSSTDKPKAESFFR